MRIIHINLSSENCFYLKEIKEFLENFSREHSIEVEILKKNISDEEYLPCTYFEKLDNIKIFGDCRDFYSKILEFILRKHQQILDVKSKFMNNKNLEINIYGSIFCKYSVKQTIDFITLYPFAKINIFNLFDFPSVILKKNIFVTPTTEIKINNKKIRFEGYFPKHILKKKIN